MKIWVVQCLEQWTGVIEKQEFLLVPDLLDMAKEEAAWFAAGGDSSGKSFADHLVGCGATRLDAQFWTINYQ
jgi:hypothetical protein